MGRERERNVLVQNIVSNDVNICTADSYSGQKK
jgi:hypothetical protein